MLILFCIAIAAILPLSFAWVSLAFIGVWMFVVVIAFGYFARVNPSLLLSEEHQHRQALLPYIIGDHLRQLDAAPVNLNPVPNPETEKLPQIGTGEPQS